jgi:hypothetical protein
MTELPKTDKQIDKDELRKSRRDYLQGLGAPRKAAKVLAKTPIAKKLELDGGVLKFDGATIPATDDPRATAYFLEGPFAGLFKRDSGNHSSDSGRTAAADASNPWSAQGWNVTRQGAVAKADMNLAKRLAKAAGSHIGAVRPTRDA